MKKIHITGILLLFINILFSQTAQETVLLDKMTKETCDELQKVDIKKRDKSEEIQMKLGLAILPVFKNNEKEIKKVWNLDITKDARLLGEKLGRYAIFKCPKFQEIAMLMMKDEKMVEKVQEKMNETPPEEPPPTPESFEKIKPETIKGKIEKIEADDLAYIYLKTNNDEVYKILWYENFNGSAILENDSYTNKEVNLQYKEVMIYHQKNKSYQKTKVIIGLEVL